jgi:hypothetical protein
MPEPLLWLKVQPIQKLALHHGPVSKGPAPAWRSGWLQQYVFDVKPMLL